MLERRTRGPARPAVVVMSAHDDAGHVDGALALGAHGYVLKSASTDEIIGAVVNPAAGGLYLQPAIARSVVKRHLLVSDPSIQSSTDLPRRQLELLRCLALGMTNKEIAALLGISGGTVGDYMKDLFTHLGVGSRAEAVSAGMRRGLIS